MNGYEPGDEFQCLSVSNKSVTFGPSNLHVYKC